MFHKGLPFMKLGGDETTSSEVLKRSFRCSRRNTFYNICNKTWLANLMNSQTTHTNKTTRDTF